MEHVISLGILVIHDLCFHEVVNLRIRGSKFQKLLFISSSICRPWLKNICPLSCPLFISSSGCCPWLLNVCNFGSLISPSVACRAVFSLYHKHIWDWCCRFLMRCTHDAVTNQIRIQKLHGCGKKVYLGSRITVRIRVKIRLGLVLGGRIRFPNPNPKPNPNPNLS